MNAVDRGAGRQCILVLGMHRSGTSAVTRVLSLLGAALPKTLMPPQDANQAGYWESVVVMAVNDDLLAKVGSRWDDWTHLDEKSLSADDLALCERQIADTIRTEMGNAPLIVLKDPRIARLAPLYLRVLRADRFDVRCVHITRNPFEVARSLQKRDEFPTEFSLLLWLRHTLAAERASRGCDRIFVTYDDLMNDDTGTVGRLARWGSGFGLSSTADSINTASGHIQGGLRHFTDNEDWLHDNDNALTRLVARAYTAIQSMTQDMSQPDVLAALDESLADLDRIAALSGQAVNKLIADAAAARRERDDLHKTLTCQLAARERENMAAQVAHHDEVVALRGMADDLHQKLTTILRETDLDREAHAKEIARFQCQTDELRQDLADNKMAQDLAHKNHVRQIATLHAQTEDLRQGLTSQLKTAAQERDLARQALADEVAALTSQTEELRQRLTSQLTAALQERDLARQAHADEAATLQARTEELRQKLTDDLAVLRAERVAVDERHAQQMAYFETRTEEIRQTLTNAVAILQKENEMLRKVATKTLRSPLVPLRDRVRYHGALKLEKLLRNANPAAAEKYARSAAKRDPKRFQALPLEVAVSTNACIAVQSHPVWADSQAPADVVRPQSLVQGVPTVILPFESGYAPPCPPMRIAVVLHAYYLEQAALFRDALKNIPAPFALFVSTDTEGKAEVLRQLFENGPAAETEVRVMPNRGRDIAPKLVGFADVYTRHDLVLCLHTKRSLHDTALEGWCDFLLQALVGSREIVTSILGAFGGAPRLGMVAPPNFSVVRPHMDWGVNYDRAHGLAARMGIAITTDSPSDFPAGSMFWARTAALVPLLDAGIQLSDFPDEAGQTDGTFAHAVERLFFYACEKAGFRWVHAGQSSQIGAQDAPLHINSKLDLEWALSDQMPALLLPGVRPRNKIYPTSDIRLVMARETFRGACKDALAAFLAGPERLSFADSGGKAKLSIVLVLFNQAELTLHCLQSLHANAGVSVEIIIFDNGSTDDTSALLDRLDGVKIVRSAENLHFLRGVNRAAENATGEHFLLLNNDTRVLPGTIPAAVDRLEQDATIGAVGGPIVLLDGTLQEAGSIIFNDGSCRGYGRGRDPGEADFLFRRDVDYCSGAFLMMRRALWSELGGFDEDYAPAYYEETDLCMRIWDSGRRIVYEPKAKIVHFEFASATSSDSAIALQQQNSGKFRRKHAQALLKSHLPVYAPPVRARQRRDSMPRVLFVDDRVPYPDLGSGYPRAAEILTEIGKAGWSATLYPTALPYISCDQAYAAVPDTTELTMGEPLVRLADFLRQRTGCFDTVLVSRPHNMVRFRAAMATVSGWDKVPVIYDAEAIFAERDAALAKLAGNHAFDYAQALASELDLAQGVRTVLSVSEAEAGIFRAKGYGDVRVLGHAVSARPLGDGPENRRNILFVGALDDDHSPNSDSLDWFVRAVMPRIDSAIGTDWVLNVAGRSGARMVQALKSDRVRILGKVQNLDTLYAQSRLFVAPTRYAAGIPMKVHEAASVGLPTVATDLLTGQLGWVHGQDLMSAGNVDDFAACCVALYRDDALWMRLREGGLDAIRRSCAPGVFRDTLRGALQDSLVG